MEHTEEPHVHTITFTDNEGQSYSFDADCPAAEADDFGKRVVATGAQSVNDVAVDGRMMPFEGVCIRLGVADQLHLLGQSYMTDQNLMKLLVGMGTHPTS